MINKNKFQEALDELTENKIYDIDDSAKKLLQELVDKETPMKPSAIGNNGRDDTIVCGSCSTTVFLEDHNLYLNRCEECGQLIDWRIENE